MPRIHNTACVDSGARIADDAEIGPFCTIGPDVEIASGCRVGAHVNIAGVTSIGARTRIGPFCSLGTPPQSVKYKGGPTRLVIGEDCDLRENVTMNTGTESGGGITSVGHHNLFMVGTHVGHDCAIGNHVTFANMATLGGHCVVSDYVVIGGISAVHQFVRIGFGAMLAGMSGARSDIIPFGFVIGSIGRLGGLNILGMKRRGLSRQAIHAVRHAYRDMFSGDGLFADRLTDIENRYGAEPAVAQVLEFVRAKSHRGICQPGSHHEDEE